MNFPSSPGPLTHPQDQPHRQPKLAVRYIAFILLSIAVIAIEQFQGVSARIGGFFQTSKDTESVIRGFLLIAPAFCLLVSAIAARFALFPTAKSQQ